MRISDILNIEEKGTKAKIIIDGVIGYPAEMQHDDSEGIATNSADLKKELKALRKIGNVNEITIEINSPGGSVNHALAMFHALKVHPAKKKVEYTGNSASAATVIAAVANRKDISIPSYLGLLIHEARTGIQGAQTESQYRLQAEDLKNTNRTLAEIYSNLNDKTTEENLSVMAENGGEGRVFTAKEAAEFGFVGQVVELHEGAAAMDYSNLQWLPSQIRKLKNNNKMGFFTKKEKVITSPLRFIKVEGRNIAYRTLSENETVEVIGTDETYNGVLNIENQAVTVEENKITSVAVRNIEVPGRIDEIESKFHESNLSLNKTISDLATAFEKQFEDMSALVERLTAQAEANTTALKTAKIAVSSPVLPTQEFRTETETVDERTRKERFDDLQRDRQNEIINKRKEA